MHIHHTRPDEPPNPEPAGSPKATAAAKRRTPAKPNLAALVSALSVLGILMVVAGYVRYYDTPARDAADQAAVVSTAPAIPVPQRTKPVEYSPKLSEVIPGDGTWLIGREIKRGTYRGEGGEWCFWERLADLTGEKDGVTARGFMKGQQFVAIGPDDVAFSTQGCGQWVMVK